MITWSRAHGWYTSLSRVVANSEKRLCHAFCRAKKKKKQTIRTKNVNLFSAWIDATGVSRLPRRAAVCHRRPCDGLVNYYYYPAASSCPPRLRIFFVITGWARFGWHIRGYQYAGRIYIYKLLLILFFCSLCKRKYVSRELPEDMRYFLRSVIILYLSFILLLLTRGVMWHATDVIRARSPVACP